MVLWAIGTLAIAVYLKLVFQEQGQLPDDEAAMMADWQVQRACAPAGVGVTGLQKLGCLEPTCHFDKTCPGKHVRSTVKASNLPGAPWQAFANFRGSQATPRGFPRAVIPW